MSDAVLDGGHPGGGRQSGDRVGSPLRLGIVVVVLGLVITLACSWIAVMLNRNNDHRLLQLQTVQAGAVLTATIADIETPLSTAAQLAAHTAGDPTVFRTYLAPYVGSGRDFAHVSLWRTSGPSDQPVEVASVGTPTIRPAGLAEMLALAPTAQTAVVRGISTTTLQRIAYAVSGGSGTGYVVYAERAIPASREVAVEKGSAFADLEYATYVGRDTSAADLATTDVPLGDLPLSGDTDRVVLPFGDSQLTLETAPQGQLGGTLGAALPWIFLVAGVLITAAIAVVSVRLRRRHALAEDDARTIARLYERLDTLYDEQRSIADSLQRALLPRKNPVIPHLDVASRFVAGADRVSVGGDWYSVIGTGGSRFAFVVGDVSGRGIERGHDDGPSPLHHPGLSAGGSLARRGPRTRLPADHRRRGGPHGHGARRGGRLRHRCDDAGERRPPPPGAVLPGRSRASSTEPSIHPSDSARAGTRPSRST